MSSYNLSLFGGFDLRVDEAPPSLAKVHTLVALYGAAIRLTSQR